ncbi:cytosolic protein [Anaerobacillus arseniciselenatis]|uniref:Cytosolic protein n=1 Tax=Anaerobacillus arseniciselenatis TaxID=85682 RepID=A0A1S2LQM9_9BACI|nr:cytosolic protein [Anaerobacillus arseniciselenatis]OIJ13997.1 cytosolic protein [Anaerobacillus arseniciselenatis]
MYVGRDMTELTMMSKKDWTNKELAFFHQNLQQMTPYLNSEGVTIHREIVKEIISRGGMANDEASYEHGTREHYD